MPIGSQVIYNAGDLILSTVSSSGNTFVETKIAAATSSVILFNNSASLTSASLSSLTVGNAISSSYALTASFALNAGGGSGTVSGSTNYIAKFISPTSVGTSSIYETGSNVGIGTTDPQYKLDVRPAGANARIGIAELGAWPAASTFAYFQHSLLNNLDGGNYALVQSSVGETFLNAAQGQVLHFRINNGEVGQFNSSGYLGIGHNNNPITAKLEVSGSPGEYLFNVKSTSTPYTLFASGSGRVGIGTNVLPNKLTIDGNVTASSYTSSIVNAVGFLGTASYALTASAVSIVPANVFVQGGNSFGATALLGTNDAQSLALETNGTTRMSINSNGNVAINTSTSGFYRLNIADTHNGSLGSSSLFITTVQNQNQGLATSANDTGINNAYYVNNFTSSTAIQNQASFDQLYINGSGSFSGSYRASRNAITISNTASLDSGGNITNTYLTNQISPNIPTFSIPNWIAGTGTFIDIITGNSTGSITNLYQHQIGSPFPSGGAGGITVTNSYGVYINKQKTTNIVTNGWGIYQADTGDLNIFAGKTRIGSTTVPVNTLDVTGNISASVVTASLFFGTSSWANNALTASYVSPNGNAFVQDGNSFGTTATLGTNDAQPLSLETNGTSRIYITSTGNVGIGTTNPGSKFTVSGSIESITDGTEGGQLILRGNTYRYNIDNYNGQALRFFREDDITTGNGLVLMQISASGNVGIGTDTPTDKLHVSGSSYFQGYARVNVTQTNTIGTSGEPGNLQVQSINIHPNSTTETLYIRRLSSGKFQLQTSLASANAGELHLQPYGGNVGIGTTSPNSSFILDVSGSTRYGFTSTNVHQFTGSVSISDGLSLTNLTASNISASNIISSRITSSNVLVNGNLTVTGSIFASLFSASYIYVTSSQLVVTDNIITLNALSPYQRYAGIEMYDSGSGNLTSFLWDGQGDYFFVTGSGVNSKIIVGPDQQTNLTSGKLTKATGTNIIGDSIVTDNGSGIIVSGYISGSSVITGNITASNISASGTGTFNSVGIGTSTLRNQLTVIGPAQNTSAISDSGNTGGTIFIGSSLNNVNQGGTLLFSTINDSGTYLPQWGIKSLFTNGSGNGVGDLAFSTRTTGSATSLTEQVRFTSNGRVGIGTNSPATTLNVSGSTRVSAGELQIEGDNASIRLYRTTGINYFDWASGQNFYLGTVTSIGGAGRSNKMVILDSGNVGIGTTIPGSKLQINDSTPTLTIRADDGGVSRKAYIDFYTTFYNYPSDTNARRTSTISTGFADGTYGTWGTEFMAFHVGSGSANDSALLPIERMRIDGSGNVGIGTNSPTALLELSSSTKSVLINAKGAAGNGLLYVSGSGYVGIGTSAPTTRLHVLGSHVSQNGISRFEGTDYSIISLKAPATGDGSAGYWGFRAQDTSNNDLMFYGYRYTTTFSGFWIDPSFSSTISKGFFVRNSDGNVGIGVSNPSGRLHVTASATSGESLIYLSKGSGSISQNFITAVNENNQSSYRVTSDINGYTQQTLYRNGTAYVYHDAYWSSYINNANYPQGGLNLGSSGLTHGYGLTIARPATSGSLYVSGSSVFTGSVGISGSATFFGPIIYDNAVLLDFGNTTTPATSTNYVVLQNVTGSYNAAFFDYFASSASNFRAGTVIAGWSGSNINYTEYATTDIGNTNQLTMSVDLSAGLVRLLTTVSTTTNWNIKSSGRYL